MSRHPLRQVDVFGAEPYEGNPVAVVLDAAGVDDDRMRRFSVWTNLSECTFVLPPTTPAADYRVRIFNLETELAFAGHPTLGTARAWVDAGGIPTAPGVVVQECGAGLVPVRIDGEVFAFAAPPRIRSGPVEPELLRTVLEILGVDPVLVRGAEWLDNGPGWIGVLLDAAETVLGLRPDASGWPGPWSIGAVGPAPEGSGEQFEVRAFFSDPSGALREDPVTGSLNAALAQWLLGSGRAAAPYSARQGTALGRHGRIRITADEEGIWVGGRTSIAVTGAVEL